MTACCVAPRLDAQTSDCTGRERTIRRTVAGATFVGANAAMYAYFDNAWWSGETRDFWVNYDWDMSFRDQDKAGHFLGGYHLTRIGSGLMRFACVSPRKAVAFSAAYATLFQLQIEIWDAKQKLYGFSPPDLLFNTAGAAWGVGQHYSRTLNAIRPTISYHQSLMRRLGVGENASLRLTTDYAGQTYWFSVNPDDLLPRELGRYWPGLLRFSAGHSVTDWRDPYTGTEIRGKRVIVLSLDVDPRRIPGNHPMWRSFLEQVSYYRFPAPALLIAPSVDGVRWYQ